MTEHESHLSVEEIERRRTIQQTADRDQARRIRERDCYQKSYAIDLRGPVEP